MILITKYSKQIPTPALQNYATGTQNSCYTLHTMYNNNYIITYITFNTRQKIAICCLIYTFYEVL